MRLIPPPGSPPWVLSFIRDLLKGLQAPFGHPIKLTSYTVATLPDPAEWSDGLIMVSDETGGIVPAFSDGDDWRRVTDRAVVS